MSDNKREMVERFMKHGIDISPYMFQSYEDKFQFFTMYIHYLESIDAGIKGYKCDFDEEINLEIYDNTDLMIGKFYITSDYQILRFIITSTEEITEEYAEHVNFLITVFFLVLKEFNANIKSIQEIFASSASLKAPDDNKIYRDATKFEKKINTILELQKSIRSENRKYQTVSTDKGEDK